MNQVNNEQPAVSNTTTQWAEQVQQTINNGLENWNSMLRGLLVNGNSNNLWNAYVKGLMEVQNVVQKVNQTVLQAYGLPTRADSSQINRQLYEINNRLDDLEAKLAAQTRNHNAETAPSDATPVLEIAHV